jgi:acyl-CoA reductase-like NAD-dependent aldehyde dehydrogenase
VTHSAIRKVSFTGGTDTGRDIARKAADKLMPVSLELGGKSPTIVFADADLNLACAGVLFGMFSSTGQSCIAGSRLFVERPIYDAFVTRLVAIVAGLANNSRLCCDEVFGPVLAVLPFEDEDDVIRQSNDNAYGLACGIHSRDFPKAWRVARTIDAATAWINTYKQLSISTPFGGTKDSGVGREKGREGIRAWMSQKSLYFDLSDQPHPWARVGANR